MSDKTPSTSLAAFASNPNSHSNADTQSEQMSLKNLKPAPQPNGQQSARRVLRSGRRVDSRAAPEEPISGTKRKRGKVSEERAAKRAKVTVEDGVTEADPVAVDAHTPKRLSTLQRKATPFKISSEHKDMDTDTPSFASLQYIATSVAPPLMGFPANFLVGDGQTSFPPPGEEDPLGPRLTVNTDFKLFESSFAFVHGRATVASKRPYFGCQQEDDKEEEKGGTATDATPADAPSTTCWTIHLEKQQLQWRCDVCSVYNEQDAKRCVACGTKNDT